MMVRGRELGAGALACDLAAILGDRDILQGEGRAPDADLQLRLEALARARGGRGVPGQVRGHSTHRGGLRRVAREADRLRKALGATRAGAAADGSGHTPAAGPTPPSTGLLTALAYPDRIGQRRPGERGRFLLRNGRGARFAEPQALEGADWLVAAEVEGRGREARIFRAAALSQNAIERHFADQLEETEEVTWDAAAGRVVARRLRVLGALTLMEAPLRDPDAAAVGRALLEGVRDAGIEALAWSKDAAQLRERLEFLGHHDPDAWPDTSMAALEASLEEWLLPFLSGKKRLDGIAARDLEEALLGRVGWERRGEVDRLAPTHQEVPSGSRVRIDYSDPRAPALAVRLQEVFGLTETPRIAGGVPLTMRLLSPAQRPVQVTQDLASFWRDAYFEVRKDMRGRYPKHYWPENPLEAEATRRTKPR
jgi:ATP-dependent helicase HrpB